MQEPGNNTCNPRVNSNHLLWCDSPLALFYASLFTFHDGRQIRFRCCVHIVVIGDEVVVDNRTISDAQRHNPAHDELIATRTELQKPILTDYFLHIKFI